MATRAGIVCLLVMLHEPACAAPHEKVTIDWDQSTLTLVAKGGGYGRITRLRSGDLMCSYQHGGQAWVKHSRDGGRTWAGPVVATRYARGVAANPEVLQKKNGDLLLLFNERPRGEKGEGQPYAISMVVSKDGGRTWGQARRLYSAGKTYDTGCWEPAAVQYPDGDIQVFFANEAPYTDSKEQQISMISSREPDEVHPVSFRAGARDGMPVPLLLKDGKTAVVAIEDNNLNGKMKPVILTSKVAERWKQGVIGGGSPRRRRALKEPLAAEVCAGAPYIRQLPSGVTLLSVQSDQGRKTPQMVVYVGDEMARDFTNRSVPFSITPFAGCMWNSLFVKNADTVTAVSGTSIKTQRGLWIIDGKVKGLEESSP